MWLIIKKGSEWLITGCIKYVYTFKSLHMWPLLKEHLLKEPISIFNYVILRHATSSDLYPLEFIPLWSLFVPAISMECGTSLLTLISEHKLQDVEKIMALSVKRHCTGTGTAGNASHTQLSWHTLSVPPV